MFGQVAQLALQGRNLAVALADFLLKLANTCVLLILPVEPLLHAVLHGAGLLLQPSQLLFKLILVALGRAFLCKNFSFELADGFVLTLVKLAQILALSHQVGSLMSELLLV